MSRAIPYTIPVSNSGPDEAPDIDLQDVLSIPGAASVDSGSYTASGLTVDCSWPSVPAGGSVQATVIVTPGTSGASSNQATVGGGDQDPDGANKQFVLNGTVDGAGGPGIQQAMPTLSRWVLAALALLLTVLGGGRARARSQALSSALPRVSGAGPQQETAAVRGSARARAARQARAHGSGEQNATPSPTQPLAIMCR